MNENLQILRAFLKNPLKVGAIAPSSPELAAQMLKGLEPDENNIILELGVGTGAITKFLHNIIRTRNPTSASNLIKNLSTRSHKNFPE